MPGYIGFTPRDKAEHSLAKTYAENTGGSFKSKIARSPNYAPETRFVMRNQRQYNDRQRGLQQSPISKAKQDYLEYMMTLNKGNSPSYFSK